MAALPDVHITIKNTSRGTFTDVSGIFTLRGDVTDTLVLTAIGYRSIALPLLLEEADLFIRMSEETKVLQEITVKATRLYPNQIADHTHAEPRKMVAYQALESPFTFFSRTEKEKRRLYRIVTENNKTQTYVQVVTDPDLKKIFMDDYELTDEAYYDLLAKFNETYHDIQYATDPDDIMEALHSYFRLHSIFRLGKDVH